MRTSSRRRTSPPRPSRTIAKDGKAIAVHGDVSKSADVRHLFAETKKAFGKLDILVNNAAVFAFAPLEAVTEAEFHREFDINVLGPILTTQEALKYFGPEGGNVINISSVVSEKPLPGAVVYAATKGALDTITGVLAQELAGRKIRVNTALGRLGQPEDIARLAVFLASSDAGWLTGERISASGGFR